MEDSIALAAAVAAHPSVPAALAAYEASRREIERGPESERDWDFYGRVLFWIAAALHEIVRAHRQLRAEGCLLALVGPSRGVARVLELSGLDQVLCVHATAEEAGAQ